jgi:hypothetical protein
MGADGEIIYRLNDCDEIGYANDAYDAFAAANEGEHVSSAAVLRHSVWEFISDLSTRQLYRDLIRRVRAGRPVRFQFRCDTPTCRRLMEMTVARGEGGAVEFRARVVSEEARPYQALLDPRAPRAGEMLRVCGWCKKVQTGEEWLELEDAVGRLGLFERPAVPPITHGVCEPCYQKMMAVIEES